MRNRIISHEDSDENRKIERKRKKNEGKKDQINALKINKKNSTNKNELEQSKQKMVEFNNILLVCAELIHFKSQSAVAMDWDGCRN